MTPIGHHLRRGSFQIAFHSALENFEHLALTDRVLRQFSLPHSEVVKIREVRLGDEWESPGGFTPLTLDLFLELAREIRRHDVGAFDDPPRDARKARNVRPEGGRSHPLDELVEEDELTES